MHKISQSANSVTFLLGPGMWSEISTESRDYVLSAYLKIAQQIIDENDLVAPEPHRLSLIVMAAVEALTLFHTATLHEPSREELAEFFADFVLRSISHHQS